MKKIYGLYVGVSALILTAAAVFFSLNASHASELHTQELHADYGMTSVHLEPIDVRAGSNAVRCFMGAKVDRPDSHLVRGWICLPDQAGQ